MTSTPRPKQKTIRLTGKAYTELKAMVYARDNGRCQYCDRWVPLNGSSEYDTAHLAHIKSRGSGGSDTPENTRILCFTCHRKEHNGR